MDTQTTIHALKQKVGRFCDDRGWDRRVHNAKDLAIGIITESSELLEHFRFRNGKEVDAILKNKAKRERVCDEIADVLHTILRFAQLYGIDLSAELARKMKKNEKKYPLRKRR